MINYTIYSAIHLFGIVLIFMSLGAKYTEVFLTPDKITKLKKWIGAFHGTGMLLSLIGGFGMIARLKIGFPGWIVAKIVIWLCLGMMPLVIRKFDKQGKLNWLILVSLALIAIILVKFKPF